MSLKDLKNELLADEEVQQLLNDKQENKTEEIYIHKLKYFEENPFKLCNDEDLEELVESIKDDGLLNPIILWKKENDYIILSGHNRIQALKKLGYNKLEKNMYKIKENISLDDARLIVVDTNLVQRKNLLPSERAKAYKIWQQSLQKKQGKRYKNFEFENSSNIVEIAEQENSGHNVLEEKRRNINRYLRLNYLISDLLNKVDEKQLSLIMAVELSYLKDNIQQIVFNYFFINNKATLNMDICKKIREKSSKIDITDEEISLIIESVIKKKMPRTFKLKFKDIKEISNKSFKTDKEAKDYILECIKFYEENKME